MRGQQVSVFDLSVITSISVRRLESVIPHPVFVFSVIPIVPTVRRRRVAVLRLQLHSVPLHIHHIQVSCDTTLSDM